MPSERGRRPIGLKESQDPLAQGSAGQSALVVAGNPGPFVTLFEVRGTADRGQALSLCLLPPTRADGAPLAAAGDDVDLEARVLFGVHGVAAEARLDVGVGGRISIAASFLRLDVRVQAAGVAVPPGAQFRVGATAGYAAAGSSQGQRTLRAAGVIGGALADFPIPAFAKAVTVLVSNITVAGGYSLTWLDAGGVAVGTMDFPVSAAAFGAGPGPEQPNTSSQNGPRAGFPIPSRAVTLRFTNGGGAAVRALVQAIFEIQL